MIMMLRGTALELYINARVLCRVYSQVLTDPFKFLSLVTTDQLSNRKLKKPLLSDDSDQVCFFL